MRETSDVLKDLAGIRKRNKIKVADVKKHLKEDFGIDVAIKTIYGWESGKVQPSMHIFVALCEIYDVPDIYELYGIKKKEDGESYLFSKKLINKYNEKTEYQAAINKLLSL